jgi:hypothetical protein
MDDMFERHTEKPNPARLPEVQHRPPELLAADDPSLGEDRALALLKRADLRAEVLARLSKNAGAMKSRKVKLALVQHPNTPRHVSIPMLRHLFTFELMQVALTPAVAADIKRTAEDALMNRLETISSGERLSLARRAAGRVAAELLGDPEPRVIHAALGNSQLTEAEVIRALMRVHASVLLVESVCAHAKWSLRRDIRVALLRNEKIPLTRVLEFAHSLTIRQLREILRSCRLPSRTREYLLREIDQRGADS